MVSAFIRGFCTLVPNNCFYSFFNVVSKSNVTQHDKCKAAIDGACLVLQIKLKIYVCSFTTFVTS